MPQYLIYGGTPFESEDIGEREIVEKNMFGGNVGNELFFNSVVRSLSDNPTHDFSRLGIHHAHIDEVKYVILPLANLVRRGCENEISNLYNLLINSCTPFVVIGVGSDSSSNLVPDLSPEVIEIASKFFNAALERTASIGVRGERTQEVFIIALGLPKDRVRVIGCPSVQYFGKRFEKRLEGYQDFSSKTKIAVYYTAYMYDNDEAIFLYKLLKNHKESYVFFTDKVEAELLWDHKPMPQNRVHDLLPTYPGHFIIRGKRANFFATQKRLMESLSGFDFTIGTRIHGIIASILSGVPGILLSTSLRTLEIAQYHNIPYIMRSDIQETTSVELLYYKACLGMKKFYESYDEKLDVYTAFLRENNLPLSSHYCQL